MEIVHAYKIYRPDADGGIPQVISCLCATKNPNVKARIVVSRPRGVSRSIVVDGIPVKAVGSLGMMGKLQLMKQLMSGNLNSLGMPGGPTLKAKKSGFMEKKDRNKKQRR